MSPSPRPLTWRLPSWYRCSLFRTGSFSDASGTKLASLSHPWLHLSTISDTTKLLFSHPTISDSPGLITPLPRSTMPLEPALPCSAHLLPCSVESTSFKYFSSHGSDLSFTKSTAQFSTSFSLSILASVWEDSCSAECSDFSSVSCSVVEPHRKKKAGSNLTTKSTLLLWSAASSCASLSQASFQLAFNSTPAHLEQP